MYFDQLLIKFKKQLCTDWKIFNFLKLFPSMTTFVGKKLRSDSDQYNVSKLNKVSSTDQISY